MGQARDMKELCGVRYLVDHAITRLETERRDSPLMNLERTRLRRLLAEAAFREFRTLQREIEAESHSVD
jgi:hypothetical protein